MTVTPPWLMIANHTEDDSSTLKSWRIDAATAAGLEKLLGEPHMIQLQTAEQRERAGPVIGEVVTIHSGEGEW